MLRFYFTVLLLVIFCTFLVSFVATASCPAAQDQRALPCTETYVSLTSGNITRNLNVFGGKLTVIQCIAYCGCLSKPYAGLDSLGYCFCGSTLGSSVDCSTTECVRPYTASGVPGSPSATFPAKVELFVESAVTVTSQLTNVTTVGVVIDNKLTYHDPSNVKATFVQTGRITAVVEMEAFWGCRTPETSVDVFSKVKINLNIPKGTLADVEFDALVDIFEGSEIQSIEFKVDGQLLGSSITNVGAPLIMAVGAEMATDRYEDYQLSYARVSGTESKTYINKNFEFHEVCRVKAFEAYATKVGYVRFQVFSCMCSQVSAEKTYCHSQKKCVSSGCGTPVPGKPSFYPPASKPVFCPDVERFKADDNSSCPGVPTITKPEVDFQLRYEYEANLTYIGTNVVKIPDDKNFTVLPGDVIGWTSGRNSSGDIGYHSISAFDMLYPEVEHSEVYETYTGSVFSRSSPTAQLFNNYHLFRAHVICPTRYIKKVTLSNLGVANTISATVKAKESTATVSGTVSVESTITGFTLSAPENAFVNTDVAFSISALNTDVSVFFSCHFGETEFNGTFDLEKVTDKTNKKQFTNPGTYTVICRAHNLINYVDRNVTVNIFGRISTIEFLKSVDPEPTGNISTSLFYIVGGGEGNVFYQLGDDSSERTLNVTFSDHFVVELQYTYAAAGDYLIRVKAKTPLETKEIAQYASVEDVIKDVVVQPPGVAATNVTHCFNISVHPGTNVTYVWEWQDATENSTSAVNQRYMCHNYTTYGNRTIKICSYNKISSYCTTIFIEVQDIIQGLQIIQPEDSKYLIKPTNETTKTEVYFLVTQGTGMDIDIDWDSEKPKTRVSKTAYDMDFYGDAFRGVGTHQYSAIGYYNVTICVRNEVSNSCVTALAIYETPLTDFREVMRQLDNQASYIEVNETVCFDMKYTQGTSVDIRYDFNDTTSAPIVTPNKTLCHSWPYWKLPFSCKFVIYNNVSSISKYIDVPVQRPVHEFKNLSISGGPENTTEEMDITLNLLGGDFFNCTWTIKDTTTVLKYSFYQDYLDKRPMKHQFKTPGTYDVDIFCENRLYSASGSCTVTSYKPASEFNIKVTYGGKCGAKKSKGDLGDGADKDMYAYECPLMFEMEEQTGSNITLEAQFEETSPKKATTGKTLTHTFLKSKDSSKVITFRAYNPVSQAVIHVTSKFLPRISGIKVGNSGPIKAGSQVSLNLTVEEVGLESCFIVTIEIEKINGFMKTKEFWIGDESCKYQTKYKAIDAKPDLKPKSAKWPEVFNHVGQFKVTVVGENSVSKEFGETIVIVLDKPCYKPAVKWMNVAESEHFPTNITRSKRYICRIKVEKDCERTDKVHYNWTLTQCGSNLKINKINTTKNDAAFEIPKHTLEYGCYRLIGTVRMADVDPPVEASVIGYVRNNPSPLVAGFEGGTGRAVGKDKLIEIKASGSYDPDIGETTDGLFFSWYCKHEAEYFPENMTALPSKIYPPSPMAAALNSSLNFTKSNFKGCFGLGMGQLISCKDKVSCFLNTTFMVIYQCYAIKVVVCKPTPGVDRKCVEKTFTVCVVDGDPPVINISPLDLSEKIDPYKAFKSLARCVSTCTDIQYRWSLEQKREDAGDETLEKVEGFEKHWLATPVDNKNLVVKENMFKEGFAYVLKLSGFPRRSPTLVGFSTYGFGVNRAPLAPTDENRVKILPTEGEPLKKIYTVAFSGYTDEDLPLKYNAEYRKKSSDPWTQFYSSINTVSDSFMLPEGLEANDHNLEVRFYCQDAYGSRSRYISKKVKVKRPATTGAVDLTAVLSANSKTDDPVAAASVCDAVLSSMPSGEGAAPDPNVLNKVADILAKTEVNSPEGAMAVAKSCSSAASLGPMSNDGKAKTIAALGKVADFVGEDTPPDIVASLTSNVFSATLTATDGISGEGAEETLEKSEKAQLTMGVNMGKNKVPGEPAFVMEAAGALLSVSSVEPGGSGGISLGGGSFDLGNAIAGGDSGTPFQVVGGNGPNKYDSAAGTKSATSSPVLSLSLATGGHSAPVKNASIKIEIPAPKNPYQAQMHQCFLDRATVVHNVKVDNNASSLFIQLKNYTEITAPILVLIRKFKSPTLSDHHWNATLPREVSHFMPNGTNKSEIAIELETKNNMRIFLDSKKDLNSTAIGDYYVLVVATKNFTDNTTVDNSTFVPINYTLTSYSRNCLFRNKTTKEWTDEGLTLDADGTDENKTVCITTHLSSFAGGGVFAKPNAIDFSKAFAGFSNIGDNPAVFSTVLSIIGLYFILLAYCRYKDKKDIEKIGVFPLEDNHPGDNYLYEIAVQTGFGKGSGTTSDVFVILVGSLGETAPRKLKNPNRKCYNKGETDAFLLSTPFSLGILKEIEIWHNNTGYSPGWYCMQVQIRDAQNDKRWSFVCNRWLAVEEDDGLIKRTIEVARKDDLTQFDFLFAQTARKNLYDGHIWFSVFTRPPRSTFTRCQRLGCCLTLLTTSMLANAMFYKDPAGGTQNQAAADSIHLGPITISVDQIRIGFTSSLVVVPVNLIIATLFQKAKPREEKPKKKNKYEMDDDEEETFDNAKSQHTISHSKISIVEKGEFDVEEQTAEDVQQEKNRKRANFLKMICLPGNEEDDEGGNSGAGSKKKKEKKKATLPHWVIYIAYALIFIGSGTSAFFVILYGFSFGKTKSEGWLVSMMVSFWQSVLVIQPVKVVAISVLVAMIIKDPKAASGEDESNPRAIGKDEVAQEGKKKKKKKIGENGEEIEESSDEEEETHATKGRPNIDFKLPDEKKLEESRQMRVKEKRMKAIIREIVIHLLFVLLCLFIGYSNMDPFANGFGHGVKSFTSEQLQKVSRVEEYWKWMDETFIPYLYPGEWYNGNPNWTLGFVADSEPSKIISMARMRQLRVKSNSCSKHPMFKDLVHECIGEYSWGNEQQQQYGPGWQPPLNQSETRKLRARKRKAYWLGLENPWKYQSVLKLKNFPFMGKFATYSGSSYAVSIGPDKRIAKLIIKGMKDNFWIDVYTRAVFVELNLYNANTNLMMIVTYVSEILPTGGWNYFDNVQAIRLYRWQGGLGSLIMVADLTLLIVTLVGLYKLVKTCKKEGFKKYMKNPWHVLDAFVTVFSIATFVCVAARLGAVMWAMKEFKNDPEVFVSFAYVGQLDYFVSAFIGFVVFAANLEFLKLLRFNRRIGLLTTTMKQSAKPLMSFGLIFFLLFLSYVSLAHFIFVDQLEDYRKLSTSIVALVQMFLGKFDVGAYINVAPTLGPFLFFSYMIVVQMVLINMFIGIICETFEEVRTDLDQQSNEHEILSFMTTRFKKMAGATVGTGLDPIYREWKSEWEQTLDSIEEKTDSIVYFLRNVEAEEVRQTHWLEPTKAGEKKRNVLKMLVGSDEFTYENEILDTLQLLDKRMKKMDVDKSRSMVYKMAKKKKKEKEEEMQSREEEEEESPNISEEEGSEDDVNEGSSDEE